MKMGIVIAATFVILTAIFFVVYYRAMKREINEKR